jgi:hypothetical protein
LSDPESPYGRIANPQLSSFSAISEKGCLAFLGEPGIGKTQTIRAEFDRQQQAADRDPAYPSDKAVCCAPSLVLYKASATVQRG